MVLAVIDRNKQTHSLSIDRTLAAQRTIGGQGKKRKGRRECVLFAWGGPHAGVGRVGRSGPSRRVFPSLHAGNFTAEKEIFRGNHDVNTPQVVDLVLVGLESGLSCDMSQEGNKAKKSARRSVVAG